jgi:hypothetical protein
MADAILDREAFARRAHEYYDQHLRAQLEREHKGEYLYLDVDTGEYEIDRDELAALARAREKHPETIFFVFRVGYPAVCRMGPRLRRRKP